MIKRNLISNFTAKFLYFAFSIPFLPLYIRFLGLEAYGLVGFYVTLSGVLTILLDLGLATTTNREMALMASKKENSHNFVRTVEVIYWAMAGVIGLVCISISPWLASHWFHPEKLTLSHLQNGLMCMGITLAALWPFGFYSGALMGLEKQVPLNYLVSFCAALRALGSVMVLAWISNTLEAFFIWHAFVNLSQSLAAAFLLWKSLPRENKPKFQFAALKKVSKFSAGMTGISLTVLILHNLDKVFLSRFLPLETFGHYAFASSLANGLYHITGPIFATFFPRFSHELSNPQRLSDLYHFSSQLVSCFIIPIACSLIFFTPEILSVLGIQNLPHLLPLLVLGTALNNLLSIPYGLQLAHGWTKLTLIQNLCAIGVLTLPWIWAVKTWGAYGAAGIMIVLNVGYFAVTIPLMHRKILKSEMKRWYIQDNLLPALSSLCIFLLARWFFPSDLNRVQTFFLLGFIFLVGLLACFWRTSLLRKKEVII